MAELLWKVELRVVLFIDLELVHSSAVGYVHRQLLSLHHFQLLQVVVVKLSDCQLLLQVVLILLLRVGVLLIEVEGVSLLQILVLEGHGPFGQALALREDFGAPALVKTASFASDFVVVDDLRVNEVGEGLCIRVDVALICLLQGPVLSVHVKRVALVDEALARDVVQPVSLRSPVRVLALQELVPQQPMCSNLLEVPLAIRLP